MADKTETYMRKPEWLRIKLPDAIKSGKIRQMLAERNLNTICSSGMCPNRGECWCAGTATFMIGGDTCTRACRFCAVKTGRPGTQPDPAEIENIVRSIKELELRHAVVTSVDRDDLPDGGAAHWATLIRAIRRHCPGVTLETLIPDFQGKTELVDIVIAERPDVISHNLETVRRLTPEVRCSATYDRSLAVLRHIAASGIRTKSGIMLGLGETPEEILQTMDDLIAVGCEVMTIGQYLQPSRSHYPVKEYITPETFEQYRLAGIEKGFRHIESSPFVRSSYHAERHVH